MPDFSAPPPAHWHHQVLVNAPLYALLAAEALEHSGCALLLHAMPAAVREENDRVSLTLCTKTGLTETSAKILIDCTGDANAVALAGYPLRRPETTQPATLSCRAAGYDPDALDYAAINAAAEQAIQDGKLKSTDGCWNTAEPHFEQWLRDTGNNGNHIMGAAADGSVGKTRLELDSGAAILRLYRFLRTQPGLENLTLESLCAECGVRETATIIGYDTITGSDYVSGRVWPDAVCYSFYPIDLHTSSGGGLDKRDLQPGVVPTVGLGALRPQGSRRILAAGRCISSDRLANSALRIQATCMATGQAAGAAGALAARENATLDDVSPDELRKRLAEHGAILPPRA